MQPLSATIFSWIWFKSEMLLTTILVTWKTVDFFFVFCFFFNIILRSLLTSLVLKVWLWPKLKLLRLYKMAWKHPQKKKHSTLSARASRPTAKWQGTWSFYKRESCSRMFSTYTTQIVVRDGEGITSLLLDNHQLPTVAWQYHLYFWPEFEDKRPERKGRKKY